MPGMDENGFLIKRLDEIKAELEEAIRANLGTDVSLLPDSIEGQIVTIFSRIYADLWEELANAYNAFNPLWVTGQSLDNLVQLNGLTRLAPAPSTVDLTCTGVNGTVIPQGSIVKHNVTGAEFETTQEATIDGQTTVPAQSRNMGAVEAVAGTLTIIETPVNGWDAVVNNQDADLGRLAETDAELRIRRARSLALAGLASLESIIAAVQGVYGVSYAGAVENFTDSTDARGLPPHSFEVIVLGGDDQAIAQAIWEKKPAGIEPHGDVSADAVDIVGDTHTMSFSRPEQIQIHLRANVTIPGGVPDGAADEITNNIIAFVNGDLIEGQGLSVGDDVIYSRMYMPFNYTYPELIVNSMELSTDGTNWDTVDIQINYNQLSVWDASRIALVIG